MAASNRLVRALTACCLALTLSAAAHAAAPVGPSAQSVVQLSTDRTRGLGVYLSSDGLIITSTKAVGRARQVEVRSLDGKGAPQVARIMARDDWFTLLQVDGPQFTPVTLGNTRTLKLNDKVIVVDDTGNGALDLLGSAVGAVTPLQEKPISIQDPLMVIMTWNPNLAGSPVFTQQGELVGLIQTAMEGNFGGSKALRVEDIRDFLARSKAQIPPRLLVVEGPADVEVQSERIGQTHLPLKLTYQPGDIITLTLFRRGTTCGIIRPDTQKYEPEQVYSLGTTQTVGVLDVVTQPPGASISVDNIDIGASPLHLDCMGPGAYEVLARKQDHEVTRARAVVNAGVATRVDLTLRRLEGFLTLATNPAGGEVWIDGRFVGHTPLQRAPVPLGVRVVSVRFPGGARVRKPMSFSDGRLTDGGFVNLPPPGALVAVKSNHIQQLYLDGHDIPQAEGWVAIRPGSRTIQARDELGNVLTDGFEVPLGGVHLVEFEGGTSRVGPVARGLGIVGVTTGGLAALLGLVAAAGIPLGVHLLAWMVGGLNDAIHRQWWIPSLMVGFLVAVPLLTLAALGLMTGLLIVPWYRLAGEGDVVIAGQQDTPVPFKATPGWEIRPSVAPIIPEEPAEPAVVPAAVSYTHLTLPTNREV